MRLVSVPTSLTVASLALTWLPSVAPAEAAPAPAARVTTCSVTLVTYPDLTVGSRGPAVRAFQCLLRRHGASIAADGVYGPRTRAAYQAVATRLGWGAWVPRVETHVWTAFLSYGTTPTLRRGSRGEAVVRFQRALRAQGLRLTVDGIYGRETERAVRDLQRSVASPVTGVVDRSLWRSMQAGGFPTD